MDRQRITILHVDPDDDVRADVAERVDSYADMHVTGAPDIGTGVEKAEERGVDCIVSAYELPDGTAFDLFQRIRQTDSTVGCIVFTEERLTEIDRTGYEELIVEYLSKRIPGTEERLPELVRTIVSNRLQVGYPVPADENSRLDALDRYTFDELSELQLLDRLTTLVKSHFDVDSAFVGLMEESSEDIVSCTGAEWSDLDRENTICTYAMLESEVTVIEDVQADPRFTHNGRLADLEIRSYAGANLTTADGHVIGELCLIDSEPRSYDEQERRDLRLFATELMEQLELRRYLPPEEAKLQFGG